jgi:hypothetical protein
MARRVGSLNKLWNNQAVLLNGVSNAVNLPRGVEQVSIFITVSAATTVSLEVAHHGSLTSEGNEPDESSPPSTWFQFYYIDTPVQVAFTTPGSAVLNVPDFEPEWIRLRSSAAATITAGYEVTGD